MTTKLLKGALTRIAAMAIAAVFTPVASAATTGGDKENPVTGETETYANIFTGETAEWNSAGNWQLKEESKVPFVSSGNFDPALVDDKTVSTSTAIDGWTLRVGAYHNASVTWSGGITKIQAGSVGCWLTADETSSITLAFNGNSKQLEGSDTYPFKLSSANAGGITWTSGLADAGNTTLPFWYYLKGAGTVVYGGAITVANAQVIKQADITLSGNATKSVQSKTLVTFGSGTTKTFTADATIKRLDSDGTDLDYDVHLAAVTTGSTTLTTDSAVGTCELVQTSTGIDLYWVDGNPDDIPPPTVYKPSININFTSGAANGLTTPADVGLGEYAIPGTSWNNLVANNNGSLSALNAADSSGVTFATAASVTISGTRGSYSCSSLTAASDLRHGYIDENGNNPTPTVTVSGIPYDKYRVIVYTATDTGGASFGYITINGKNYTYVNDALTEGTTAWGNAGAQDSAEPIAEGTNVLVSAVMLGSTLTVVGHRDTNARGCIAAIQIVEYVPEVVEGVDLMIPVMGATTYTVSETKELSGTVYVVGSGTLTLDGTAKITAATIDVAKDVVLNVNADRLDGTTFTGRGTVVYNNSLPVTGKGWTDSDNWLGTVWINGKSGVTDFNVNSYGNANSAVKLSGIEGWVSAPFDNTVPVILENGTFDYALKLTNGNSPNNQNPTRCATFVKVSGSGTISDGNAANPMLKIYDGTEFTGTLTLTRAKVVFCSADSTTLPAAYTSIPNASVYVDAGNSATVASGMTWTADGGFIVDGTLTVDGTLASSQAAKAVSGSGTVVFNGKLPSPTGDAWWKNSDWDGIVQIAGVTDLVGGTGWTGSNFLPNDYGNSESILELKNCSGWLPNDTNYHCTVPLKVSGTLTINNGISGNKFVISKLLGSGAIYTTNNGATVTIQVLNADDFTGYVNLNSKRVIFGETIPATFTSGQIYVGNGFSFTVPNSDAAWYGTGGILLDGELKATSLSNFGGGTTITTTDNGVFTLINSNNTDDKGEDYARITGTGTLRYADVSGKWRSLSAVNFPTNMICENNLSSGLILTTIGENTIGSLAGDGYLRSDWGGSKGDRDLRVLQATNTTWSGKFWTANEHRLRSLIVAPGTTTSGTLTISATHEAAESTGLIVESGAAVNLTGTWVGATTVAGTFGGTGTLTGNLTLTDGATIKVNDISDSLDVSGSLTATGAITIELPEGAGKCMVITTGSRPDISGATFTTKIGGVEKKLKVTATANGLKVGLQSLLIRIR